MLGFWDLLRLELRTLLADRAIMLTLFGGVLFYSFLYPQPYLHQLPREEAVVVVNEDGSQLSRQLEFMADATPQVKLVARAASLDEARHLLLTGKGRGILHIPRHFYRDLMQGKSVTLGYAGDASYFLVYGTIAEGLAQAGGGDGAHVRVRPPCRRHVFGKDAVPVNTGPGLAARRGQDCPSRAIGLRPKYPAALP